MCFGARFYTPQLIQGIHLFTRAGTFHFENIAYFLMQKEVLLMFSLA